MRFKSLLALIFIAMPMMVLAQRIEINDINFPDDNFRTQLIMRYGEDNHVFTDEEIQSLTVLRMDGYDIESLDGIKYFTALTQVDCHNNKLTSLDVSQNAALTQLNCSNNQLTSLNVTGNEALADLSCTSNQLASLDLSHNAALKTLDCASNKLTSLDLSQNVALKSLFCDNNLLDSLDLSQNAALTALYCQRNQLTSLNLSQNTEIESIECYSNQLFGEAMDSLIGGLPQNLSEWHKDIYIRDERDAAEGNVCTTTQVAAIRAKGWRPLCYSVEEGKWVEYEGADEDEEEKPKEEIPGIRIDMDNFPDENFRNYLLEEPFGADAIITDEEIQKVIMINVDGRNIASLKGVEIFTSLVHLSCDNNLLTALDVSPFKALMYLSCHSNQISGEAMDALIEGLPQNLSEESEYKFDVYDATDDAEGNVCTESQVAAIMAKGWTPYYFDGEMWVECKSGDDGDDDDDNGDDKDNDDNDNDNDGDGGNDDDDNGDNDDNNGDDDDNDNGGNDDNNGNGDDNGDDDENEEPDVIVLPANDVDAAVSVYSLAGRKVESSQVKKGIYVIGGKKVMAK